MNRKGNQPDGFAYARCKLKLPQKTMSLWSWVNRPPELSRFKNPLFEANSLVIWPSVAPQSLQLWEGKPGLRSSVVGSFKLQTKPPNLFFPNAFSLCPQFHL